MSPRWNSCWLLAFALVQVPGVAADEDVAPATLECGEYTVKINGLTLWYKVSGTGPVCLMPSPAWSTSSDMYFHTLKCMERTFTVVYVDSRGTGRSGRARSAKEYTWDHLVADLEALRIHLRQDRVWLMGHSAGGVQVLHYACKHPKQVSGMVLLNSVAVTDARHNLDVAKRMLRRSGEPWFKDAAKALMALTLRPKTDDKFASVVDDAAPLFWSDPKKMAAFEDAFDATKLSAAALEGQKESSRSAFDLTTRLKAVKAPALIVTGDDDFISSPQAATRLHLALPNSKLLLIEDCGHFPWMEQPKEFAARVPEFLAALGLPMK